MMMKPDPLLAKRFSSYQCPECDQVCTSKGGLTRHTRTQHPVLSSNDSQNAENTDQRRTRTHPELDGEYTITMTHAYSQ